jgi:hypothetical protein
LLLFAIGCKKEPYSIAAHQKSELYSLYGHASCKLTETNSTRSFEVPLRNIYIELFDSSKMCVAGAWTDGTGYYVFPSLQAGIYYYRTYFYILDINDYEYKLNYYPTDQKDSIFIVPMSNKNSGDFTEEY